MARCEIARVAHVHADVAVEAGEDLGRGAAAALDLDQRVELARDVGRRVAFALQAQPLREVDAEQAHVGGPERLLAAPVELQVAGELALRGDALEIGDRQHAVGEQEVGAHRAQRLDQVGARIEQRDVDQDVGVHRAQRRQVELLVGNDAAAVAAALLAVAAAGASARRRGPEVGEQHARTAEPARQQRHLRPLVVGERAVEPARADVADSNTAFQTPPSLTSVPWVLNAGVVGKVMPSASPTAASDGPASLKRPLRPVKWSGSSVLPSKLSSASGRSARAATAAAPRASCAFAEEAEHAGGAQVDANRQLPVLADRVQAQAALAGRQAHAVGDLRSCRRGAAGADDDAAARRAARRAHRDAERRRRADAAPAARRLPAPRRCRR